MLTTREINSIIKCQRLSDLAPWQRSEVVKAIKSAYKKGAESREDDVKFWREIAVKYAPDSELFSDK